MHFAITLLDNTPIATMATTTEPKSVSFNSEAVMLDENGKVTEVNGSSDKTSAESHSAGECHVSPDAVQSH